jgi:hypothetical protein
MIAQFEWSVGYALYIIHFPAADVAFLLKSSARITSVASMDIAYFVIFRCLESPL